VKWHQSVALTACVWTLFVPVATAQDPVSVMSRMTMVVADIEASKRFYVRGLGYEVVSDNVITNPIVKTQMGLDPDRTVRFAILQGQAPRGGAARADPGRQSRVAGDEAAGWRRSRERRSHDGRAHQ
jgi:catechol 2,3-dioxygenase-like lactoylglutathione lyase family enzyme